MGTKVHHKSYLPGYYSMGDINGDLNSSWPRYHEDKTLNGQFCNGFAPRPLNGYLDYDKEVLKLTMLKHEEIFRKQVFELHRLYRKQRDLMEELKRNGEQNFSMQVQLSQSSPFSTQMFPKGMDKSWQVHGYPSNSASCSRIAISGVDYSQSHLNSLNGGGFQAGLLSRENGISQVSQLPDSGVKKLPRKMLDLELPADAYIDIEDAEHAEEKNVIEPLFVRMEPNKRNSGLQPENNVKLTLGSAQDPCSSSYVQNGLRPHNLADLNEPLEEESCKEVSVSSSRFPVQMTCSQALQKDICQDRYGGGEAGSVFLHMERSEKGQEWAFLRNEIGQSSSYVKSLTSSPSNKNNRPLFEPVPVKPEEARDFSLVASPKQDTAESWSKEKQSRSIELFNRSYHTVGKTYSGLTVPTTPSPLSALPLINCGKTGSPMLSSWTKSSNSISHKPVAVQAFPCFSGSTLMNTQSTSSHNLENACEKWQCNRDFKSTPKFAGETHWYPNGFRHGFRSESGASSSVHWSPRIFSKPNTSNGPNAAYEILGGHGPQMSLNGLHCMDVKNERGMNLNLAPPNGFQNGFIPKVKLLIDVEGKKESPSGGISWLRTKSPCNEPLCTEKGGIQKELASVQGHSQRISSYCTSALEVEQEKGAEASSSLEVLQDLPSVLKPEGTTVRQNEAAAASSSELILGFSVAHGTQQTDIAFTPVSHQGSSLGNDVASNTVKEGLLPAVSSCHSKLLELEKQIHVEVIPEKGTEEAVNYCFRGDINLNSSAASVDQSKSSESSSKDEIELPSPTSLRGNATRFASVIDLEAPATSLPEEQAQLPEPAPQIQLVVQPVEPESRKEGLGAPETLHESLARVAAETIQKISMDRPIHLEDAACHPLPHASSDTLHWFADLVTSSGNHLENVEPLKGEGGADKGSSDIDGMDYFEYMTLNLTETRVDQYCCRPVEGENQGDETGVAHLLLTKPRRGQARRRRQRRDFQRDILPGLASLSRHEVTEDLQVIGGLMRASGQPWKAGGARRNAGRSRPRRQPKGGGRPRKPAASAMAETTEGPRPRQPNKEGAEVEGSSILGWGRTTKRCRRQRCPPGNSVLLPPPS
uniref:Phosphoglycerate kinase, cytosolic n=2 Tax=Anthurium amnicola TaxID=1678845 RepID=A0A1D1YG12_9ARAE